jgi:hypothetical protein
MKALVTGIQNKPSRYGGTFKYIFFKSLETGKSFKTCINPAFGNAIRWQNIQTGVVLDNLLTKGGIVDADSVFIIIPGDSNAKKY